MPPTIHLIRHGESTSNARISVDTADPPLTDRGMNQCVELRKKFFDTFLNGPHRGQPITHLVTSPMRRALMTAWVSVPIELGPNKKMIALPELQECKNHPSNIGSHPDTLKAQGWERIADISRVLPGWNDKSPGSKFADDPVKHEARAKEARIFIRDLARQADDNAHIVVVAHGSFLRYFTQVFEEGQGWSNCQCRSYQFAYLYGTDDEAFLVRDNENFKTLGYRAYRMYQHDPDKKIIRDWRSRPLPKKRSDLEAMWKMELDLCGFRVVQYFMRDLAQRYAERRRALEEAKENPGEQVEEDDEEEEDDDDVQMDVTEEDTTKGQESESDDDAPVTVKRRRHE